MSKLSWIQWELDIETSYSTNFNRIEWKIEWEKQEIWPAGICHFLPFLSLKKRQKWLGKWCVMKQSLLKSCWYTYNSSKQWPAMMIHFPWPSFTHPTYQSRIVKNWNFQQKLPKTVAEGAGFKWRLNKLRFGMNHYLNTYNGKMYSSQGIEKVW